MVGWWGGGVVGCVLVLCVSGILWNAALNAASQKFPPCGNPFSLVRRLLMNAVLLRAGLLPVVIEFIHHAHTLFSSLGRTLLRYAGPQPLISAFDAVTASETCSLSVVDCGGTFRLIRFNKISFYDAAAAAGVYQRDKFSNGFEQTQHTHVKQNRTKIQNAIIIHTCNTHMQ